MQRERLNAAGRVSDAMRDEVQAREELVAELESHLEVDRQDIDGENARQPQFFYKASQLVVEATAERDHLKNLLQQAESQAQNSVRQNIPLGAKPTVGEVDAMVRLDPTVSLYHDRMVLADKLVGRMVALQKAFAEKSYKLHDAIEMQIAAGSPIDMEARRAEVNERRKQYYETAGRMRG